MAAALNALRTALTRIGFTATAATYLTDNQGLNSLDEFSFLSEDAVKGLCAVARKPGGMIPNPHGNDPSHIPNPGIAITLRAENHLKLMCYQIRLAKRCSETILPTDITLASVRELQGLRDWEESHKDAEPPEINAKDWPRTIDALQDYFRNCLGTMKIPLAYVIRDSIAPSTNPSTDFATKQDEMISKAPIGTTVGGVTTFDPTFKKDNTRVWTLLAAITRDQDCWTYVKPFQRKQDGREAYLALRNHYIGTKHVDTMSSRAENILSTTSYNGEKRRWTFEKYVTVYKEQHTILNGLTEYGYAGIDERIKVRKLLEGIKVEKLDVVKSQILSSPHLRTDFDACVDLFNQFIAQQQSFTRDVHLASMSTHQTTNAESAPDMSVDDRYYNKEEYKKLTAAQKHGLKIKRSKRGHKPSPKKKQHNSKFKLTARQIKAVISQLKDNNDDNLTTNETEENNKENHEQTTNRNNKALQRNK